MNGWTANRSRTNGMGRDFEGDVSFPPSPTTRLWGPGGGSPRVQRREGAIVDHLPVRRDGAGMDATAGCSGDGFTVDSHPVAMGVPMDRHPMVIGGHCSSGDISP